MRGKKQTIGDAQKYAEVRGGKCLSAAYSNCDEYLTWECGVCSNVWESTFTLIKRGHWCPNCMYNEKRVDTNTIEKVVVDRGGCVLDDLDTLYKNNKTKFDVKCGDGHTFRTSWCLLRDGWWCNVCSGYTGENICRAFFEEIFGFLFVPTRPPWLLSPKGYPMELDGYCKELGLAFEHNGRQHYETVDYFGDPDLHYRMVLDDLKVKLCNEHGIKLIVIPVLFQRTKINDLKSFIKTECFRLGMSLPEDYDRMEINLDAVYKGSHLTPKYKHTIEEMREIAETNGGVCLSEAYNPYSLKWQCNGGHIWEASSGSILGGIWCQECPDKRLRYTLVDMHALAAKYGGKCLSTEFLGASKKLVWQCKRGHKFEATPNRIMFNNVWCAECNKIERRGMPRRFKAPRSLSAFSGITGVEKP